jgi:hypothetical protein
MKNWFLNGGRLQVMIGILGAIVGVAFGLGVTQGQIKTDIENLKKQVQYIDEIRNSISDVKSDVSCIRANVDTLKELTLNMIKKQRESR